MMKVVIICSLVLASLSLQCGYSQEKGIVNNDKGMIENSVVVELFTSEGCSSCPPADALMPVLKDQYKDRLIILSFHVDYWNRLGWKDVFSSSAYSQRQRLYATAFRSESVYTPQAVVNGRAHTTGSKQTALQQLIDKELQRHEGTDFTLITTKQDGKNIAVSYKATLGKEQVMNIALVQQHATTQVKRGENSGRQLSHYNVVRNLRTEQQDSGELIFNLPDGLAANAFHVVAYIQNTANMHILSAKEVSIL